MASVPARQKTLLCIPPIGQSAWPSIDPDSRTMPTHFVVRTGCDRFDEAGIRRQVAARGRQGSRRFREADDRQLVPCRNAVGQDVKANWNARAGVPIQSRNARLRPGQCHERDRHYGQQQQTASRGCSFFASPFQPLSPPTMPADRLDGRRCGRRGVGTLGRFPSSGDCRACAWPCAGPRRLREQ